MKIEKPEKTIQPRIKKICSGGSEKKQIQKNKAPDKTNNDFCLKKNNNTEARKTNEFL